MEEGFKCSNIKPLNYKSSYYKRKTMKQTGFKLQYYLWPQKTGKKQMRWFSFWPVTQNGEEIAYYLNWPLKLCFLGMETWDPLWFVRDFDNHSGCDFLEHKKESRLAYTENVGKRLHSLIYGMLLLLPIILLLYIVNMHILSFLCMYAFKFWAVFWQQDILFILFPLLLWPACLINLWFN